MYCDFMNRYKGATRWATRTTDLLPRRITIVATTGRGIEQTSSDEGLWQRPKRQGKNVGCVEVIVFLQCIVITDKSQGNVARHLRYFGTFNKNLLQIHYWVCL